MRSGSSGKWRCATPTSTSPSPGWRRLSSPISRCRASASRAPTGSRSDASSPASEAEPRPLSPGVDGARRDLPQPPPERTGRNPADPHGEEQDVAEKEPAAGGQARRPDEGRDEHAELGDVPTERLDGVAVGRAHLLLPE